MKDDFYSVAEYAALKGISRQAVYQKLNNGTLQSVDKVENGKKIKYIYFKDQERDGEQVFNQDVVKVLNKRIEELTTERDKLYKRVEEQQETITDLAKRLADIAERATQATVQQQYLQAAATAPAADTPEDLPEEETAAPAAQQQRGILQRLRSFFSGK
ncbi:MAG: hypothetical protein IKN49_05110 [Elusimicrobiaceae bacterium]|nr:hypothetical protein [Elusimicrobiaceae bacterium]